MIQYECTSKIIAIKKICELLGIPYTKAEKEIWFTYFNNLLKNKLVSDTVDCIGYNKEKDEEYDCYIFFGFDYNKKLWYVGLGK